MAELESVMRIIASVSLVIGAIECFAGFKIMKAMLAIWGFFIGAVIGVVVGAIGESMALAVILAIFFGIGLAILAYRLYLAGVFILIAFLTTVAIYVIAENITIALLVGFGVGALAIFFVKPIVIISTAFSGAGMILSSAYLMMDLGINETPVITAILWIPIAISGMVVQYVTTQGSKKGKRVSNPNGYSNPSMTFSERRYPGMQRAYRNFCIKCGCELQGINECPRCGFTFDA